LTGRIVPAPHAHYDAAPLARQAGAFDHLVIEANKDRTDRAEPILDDRVGRKSSGHRDERNVLAASARRKFLQHGAYRAGQPDR
jgi:hypothetical protein